MKMLLAVLEMLLLLTNTETIQPEKHNVSQAFTLCVENTYEPSGLYEKDGILKGAGIIDDLALGDMDSFETANGVQNDIYINDLKKGENFPNQWVNEVYSKNKIPMIILHSNIDLESAGAIALNASYYKKPMFIELDFENNSNKFTLIANEIKKIAPNTAIVWAIDSNSDSLGEFYPKNTFVDWIAINTKSKCQNGGIASQVPNVIEKCKYFGDKPIMINLSVSHFSNINYTYYNEQAKNEMTAIYHIASNYKGVKAINYISYSDFDYSIAEKNSYKISENPSLQTKYAQCVQGLGVKKYFYEAGAVAYLINDQLYVTKNNAERLGLEVFESKYSNLKILKNANYDTSLRKVFVKSSKM